MPHVWIQRDGEGQDQDGGDHGVEALGDAGHGVLEGDDPAGHQIDDGEEQSDDAAPGQTHEGVGIAEGADEVSGAVGAAPGIHAEEAAHVDHAGGAHGDQHQNREQQVDDLALGVHGFILCVFQSGEPRASNSFRIVQRLLARASPNFLLLIPETSQTCRVDP